MNVVNTPAQPYNGQRRQQRPPQDALNQVYAPLSATGQFFLPDSQDPFTFSAEPSPMVYDHTIMTLLPTSNTPSQDPVYTPNLASSFDSTLHPNMVNYSYPSVNGNFAHNYSLSPGSYNGNGNGNGNGHNASSPSHSVEHLTPDAGYISDPSIPNPSAYTSPNFNGQHLDESLANFNINDSNDANTLNSYPGDLAMPTLTAGALSIFNAQPPTLSNYAHLESHNQLLSPSMTNNSSPIIGEKGPNITAMQYAQNLLNATPPNRAAQMPNSAPIQQTQSPALTNSPGNVNAVHPRPLVRHLTSPIVRVEHYSREDSPSKSDNSRSLSKRSHGSHRSGNHLSPYPQDDSSDEEEDTREQIYLQPAFQGEKSNEDGFWLATGLTGQAGLSPEQRQAMENATVPSLDEMVEQRAKHEKKLEIKEWLSKSEVGSETGEVPASNNLLVPHIGRRRAKSTNDLHRRGAHGSFGQNSFGLGVRTDFSHYKDAGIPGPGVYVDAQSEFDDYDDYDDDDDDDDGDNGDESAEPESPPATINIQSSHDDDSFSPHMEEPVSIIGTIFRPWVDFPSQSSASSTRYQPPTSNAAMMRFRLRAKDVESASLTATIGSRRLSESDLGSVRASPGITQLVEPDPKKQKERQRRPSFLDNILPKRAPSNLLKRKGSVLVTQCTESATEKSKDPGPERPKRIGSWGRPKSPRVDTNLSNHSKDGGSPSGTGLTVNSGPWYQGAKNVIKRSRSRSDIGKSPGLTELMTRHGGPPMPMLASPIPDTEAIRPSAQQSPADEDDDDEQEPVTMNLEVRSDPIIPTHEGFRSHTQQLNPRLADFMVERITQEQMRRYKRLLEFKVKHLKAVQSRNCPSGKFCPDLDGGPKYLPTRVGNKDSDAPSTAFFILGSGSSDDDDDGDAPPEGTVLSNPFPPGVPQPPVKRLPAEFECPLCFKVKKFYKPSDWTKHVHEDVQPFTCTFPNCGEPKSFKRKADWVRHENERHRQLENWTCQISDCNHTCYRKDNFVQHLVREHKVAEPRQRTGRAGNKEAPPADQEDIWTIVDRCRRDTTKQPKDEPCRFCGNLCTTWKKLTVHLAQHMQQISLPILPLIEQKQLNADSIISPVVEIPESRKLSMSLHPSPIENPSRYNPNTGLAPRIEAYSQCPQDEKSDVASSVMHTYPPPQMMPYKGPQSAQINLYSNYVVTNGQTYASQTYPGIQQPPKLQNEYSNGLQIPNQTYQSSQYGISPVSAVQHQAVYTDSPVDTTAFPNYFTQEAPNLSNGVSGMGFDSTNTMPCQQQTGTYQAMAYLKTQHNYQQYQGQ